MYSLATCTTPVAPYIHTDLKYQRMGCPCLLAEVHAMTTMHTLFMQSVVLKWWRSTDHTLCETRHMAYSMHTCSGAVAHTHAHVSTHTHTHTFWWQIIQHLSSKFLHIWQTVDVYGHFAVHPQSSHISITHQVLKQNFLCVCMIGILNLCPPFTVTSRPPPPLMGSALELSQCWLASSVSVHGAVCRGTIVCGDTAMCV